METMNQTQMPQNPDGNPAGGVMPSAPPPSPKMHTWIWIAVVAVAIVVLWIAFSFYSSTPILPRIEMPPEEEALTEEQISANELAGFEEDLQGMELNNLDAELLDIDKELAQ